ncbi:MAG: hypothetical protein JJU45_12365 [Acidimicrobiia bacterium]|nr:hypothetical protein [Acidimicrobiia bacterium]
MKLLVGAGGVLAVAVGTVAVLSRPFLAPKRAAVAPVPLSVYEPSAVDTPVVSPFNLDTQPMRALALFNFEGDPDRIYKGLEPQAFDDDVHGRGLLVIGWRVDGGVDVFHDPGLRLDPASYAIAGGGLHRMEPRDLSGGRLELGSAGALIDVSFTDLEDRPVRLVAHETDTRRRRPFALLAPMGSAATDPPALPLVFVKDFYFVRRAGSEIRIEIDGRAHRSDTLPLMLDGTWMHFVRYSAKPLVALWNHQDHDTAEVLPPSAPTANAGGVHYELRANGSFREIRCMERSEGDQQVTVEFDPALPHLLALRDRATVDGSFRVTTVPPAGELTGTWQVARRGQQVEVGAVPAGGWTPGDAQRTARLLFRVIKMFRSWPTTYRWRGLIDVPHSGDNGGSIPLVAGWERT